MKIHITEARTVTLRAMLPGEDSDIPSARYGAYGYYDDWRREIVIQPNLTAYKQAEVVLHEIIHAIWAQREMPKRATEESVCTHLGVALALVMALNPALCEALECGLRSGKHIVQQGEQT